MSYFRLSEKESEIKKLLAEVESKKKEVSSLQEQMETQKKKNNVRFLSDLIMVDTAWSMEQS